MPWSVKNTNSDKYPTRYRDSVPKLGDDSGRITPRINTTTSAAKKSSGSRQPGLRRACTKAHMTITKRKRFSRAPAKASHDPASHRNGLNRPEKSGFGAYTARPAQVGSIPCNRITPEPTDNSTESL